MKHQSWRIVRSAAVVAVSVALTSVGMLSGAPLASAAPATSAALVPARAPVVNGSGYLALGDSITFGYREATTTPAPNYHRPRTFVGYPEDIGAALGLRVANAACPGETSASFINKHKQSNGCESEPGGGPGYRTAYPLHVSYKGSQLQYATSYLKSHSGVRLVSLMIGANDAFLCEAATKDGCLRQFAGVLKKIGANVTRILTAIRADYGGQIVILNYYSLNYGNALDNYESRGLNEAMDTAAKPFDVRIANGYQAFRVASVHSGNNTCTAGLLTTLKAGGCGVHPSVAGQALLAQAIERVVRK